MRSKSIARAVAAVFVLGGAGCALAGCEGAEASLTPTKQVVSSHALILAQASHALTTAAAVSGPFGPADFTALAGPVSAPLPPPPATSAGTTLDLAGIVGGARTLSRSAERTAVELPALRRAVTLCALALFAVGVLNAVLLGAILQTLRAGFRVPPGVRTAPVARPETADPPACRCGEPISPRSQSGRCRRCARRIRTAPAA